MHAQRKDTEEDTEHTEKVAIYKSRGGASEEIKLCCHLDIRLPAKVTARCDFFRGPSPWLEDGLSSVRTHSWFLMYVQISYRMPVRLD